MRGAKGSPSLETILRIADNAGHSDVHLGVGERPPFRARGDIQTTDWPTTDDAVFQGLNTLDTSTTAIPADKPIMARRPFQISA